MQVAAEALELRREEHRVRLIDLAGRPAAARPGPTDGAIRSCDAIELDTSTAQPAPQRRGAHLVAPMEEESGSVGNDGHAGDAQHGVPENAAPSLLVVLRRALRACVERGPGSRSCRSAGAAALPRAAVADGSSAWRARGRSFRFRGRGRGLAFGTDTGEQRRRWLVVGVQPMVGAPRKIGTGTNLERRRGTLQAATRRATRSGPRRDPDHTRANAPARSGCRVARRRRRVRPVTSPHPMPLPFHPVRREPAPTLLDGRRAATTPRRIGGRWLACEGLASWALRVQPRHGDVVDCFPPILFPHLRDLHAKMASKGIEQSGCGPADPTSKGTKIVPKAPEAHEAARRRRERPARGRDARHGERDRALHPSTALLA